MSRHNDAVYLSHMRDFALAAIEIVHGKARSDVENDRVLRYALLHVVTVLDEATSKVSSERRRDFPNIARRANIGTRNHLIHGYDMLNLELLWDTIVHDLPEFVTMLEGYLTKMQGDSDDEGALGESQ